ncbi:MAG: hypothetical protein GY810_15145 [Aureispira sp.]|nr:hypothetical protein [Aureispira sp.]
MFTQIVSLQYTPDQEEEAYDNLNLLIGLLRRNGQIIGKEYPIFKENAKLYTVVMTPENESLKDLYANKYVLAKKEVLGNSLTIQHLGHEVELENSNCSCSTPSYYILHTNYLKLGSPLHCGDCFGEVPLYRLGNTEDYSSLLSWESNYVACDTLQMNCTVGERFGLGQMSKVDSALSISGRAEARLLTQLIQKPVYYYLYNYRKISEKQDKARKCPSCHKDWYLDKQLHHLFDFKCDDCNLLSNLSTRS